MQGPGQPGVWRRSLRPQPPPCISWTGIRCIGSWRYFEVPLSREGRASEEFSSSAEEFFSSAERGPAAETPEGCRSLPRSSRKVRFMRRAMRAWRISGPTIAEPCTHGARAARDVAAIGSERQGLGAQSRGRCAAPPDSPRANFSDPVRERGQSAGAVQDYHHKGIFLSLKESKLNRIIFISARRAVRDGHLREQGSGVGSRK